MCRRHHERYHSRFVQLSSVNHEGFRANDFARHAPRKDMDTVLKTTQVMWHVRVQRRPSGRPRQWMTDFSASISALEPVLAWVVWRLFPVLAQSVAYTLILTIDVWIPWLVEVIYDCWMNLPRGWENRR